MSDLAISLRGIGKSYRRFTTRFWQAAALLSCPVPPRSFDVFWAIEDVSLDVRRGERVGIIGRNGAGKTTLLRIVAGQVAPSCGSVRVDGQVQALLELGTSFHPEFTALQNMRTALALNGFGAREIAVKIEEVIEFTELDEFLDRPLREYSTGMYARLAFAVATTVKPSVLIIDEILGAGDAYFIGKCIQRIHELAHGGTTVLFVSHDLGAVQMLCERTIWLHRGSVRADGSSLSVGKSYQAHIREEEEIRLRARAMSLSRPQIRAIGRRDGDKSIALYRLVGQQGERSQKPCHVRQIRFGAGNETLATVTVGGSDTKGEAHLIVEPLEQNWSKVGNFGGVRCRAFDQFESRYRHAPFVMRWPDGVAADRWLELDIAPSPTGPIGIEAYDAAEQDYRNLGTVAADVRQEWHTIRVAVTVAGTMSPTFVGVPPPENDAAEIAAEDTEGATPNCKRDDREMAPDVVMSVPSVEERYGSGEMLVVDFGFYDVYGTRRHTLVTGEPAVAILVYDALSPVNDPVAVIAIYRADGICAMQLVSRRDEVEFGRVSGRGEIVARLDSLLLGPGDYVVSVALFKQLDLRGRTEPAAYDLHDRAYPLQVLPPEGVNCAIGIVNQRADWVATASARAGLARVSRPVGNDAA